MVVAHRFSRTAFQPSSRMHSWLVCLAWLAWLAWLVPFAAGSLNQSFGQDWRVRLDDGSSALGQLVPSVTDDTIAIQMIGFKSPFDFDASAIVSLSRQGSNTDAADEQQQGILHFEMADGNCFTGKLNSVDAERLSIESSVLGRLDVDRSKLRSISTNNNLGKRLYNGPSTGDRWFAGKSSETTSQIESTGLSALEGGITVATNLELPEKSHIMLELTWNGMPNFVIVLGTTKTTFPDRIEEAKASARLEVWNSKLVLVRETDMSSEVVFLLDLSNPSVKQIRINIHLDQRSGEIAVMNEIGRQLGELKQQAKNPQVGKCFQISSYGGPLSLDHLQVRQWSENLIRKEVEKDTVLLVDGKTLMASLDSWDAGGEKFIMRTPNGEQTSIKQSELRQMSLSRIAGDPIQITQSQQANDFPFVVLSDQSRFQAKFLASSTDRLKLEIVGVPGNYEIACSQIENIFGARRKSKGDTKVTSNDEWLLGKAGILKMVETELRGRLSFDGEGKGATALVWQPSRSRNVSSLNENANGLIVFREASAKAQEPKGVMRVTKPNETLLFLGGKMKSDHSVSGQLAFENGDVIDGKIVQIDDQGVTFESKQTTSKFASHEQIQSISLAPLSSKTALSTDLMKRLTTVPRIQKDHAPTHLLISISGDYVRGRLQSLNRDEIEMVVRNNTSKIPRASVSTIIWLHHRDWQQSEVTTGEVVQPMQAAEEFSVYVLRKNDRGITFQPRSLEAGKLSGVSHLFGDCMVDLEEADRIFFGTDLSKHVKSTRQYPWTLSLARYPLDFQESEGKDQPAGSTNDTDR